MTDVIEIWADTGKTVTREYNSAETAQREKDKADADLAEKAIKAAEAAAKKARVAAIAHAKSLGFTDEMIAVMYPTLVEE